VLRRSADSTVLAEPVSRRTESSVSEEWSDRFRLLRRRGEMVSNRPEDHEISMLALHLIQNCMVYINTLMIQAMLAKPHWQGRLTTPLRNR
jgi:TnpA family transposase